MGTINTTSRAVQKKADAGQAGNARPRRTRGDAKLIADIGSAAGRLFSSMGRALPGPAKTANGDGNPLVAQALDAAEEIEYFLAEQSARIAYLENLTLTDELTGLRNRRGFNEELRRTLAAANRYGDEGVLVFCDLDNFKAVNDSFGHHVGDLVLRHVARVIEAHVRETDIVARLGGDEFAVLMVQTHWRDGYKRARMLNRVVNRTILTHHGHQIHVRASFGVEPFGPHDDEGNLIARADMAMYVNKRKKAAVLLGTAAE